MTPTWLDRPRRLSCLFLPLWCHSFYFVTLSVCVDVWITATVRVLHITSLYVYLHPLPSVCASVCWSGTFSVSHIVSLEEQASRTAAGTISNDTMHMHIMTPLTHSVTQPHIRYTHCARATTHTDILHFTVRTFIRSI